MGGTGSGTVVTVTTDYISRTELKTYLDISDTTDDTLLDSIIARVGDAFRTRWSMPTTSTTTESRYVLVDGPTIYADELVSVTSITDSCGSALSYTSIPGKRSGDFIRWVKVDAWPWSWETGDMHDYVYITGTWGYASTPEDIKQAALETAAVWYKRMKGGGEVDNSFIGNLDAIPKTARQLLDMRWKPRG